MDIDGPDFGNMSQVCKLYISCCTQGGDFYNYPKLGIGRLIIFDLLLDGKSSFYLSSFAK